VKLPKANLDFDAGKKSGRIESVQDGVMSVVDILVEGLAEPEVLSDFVRHAVQTHGVDLAAVQKRFVWRDQPYRILDALSHFDATDVAFPHLILAIARRLEERNDLERAQAVLAWLGEPDDADFEHLNAGARLFAKANKVEDAIAWLRKAAALRPADASLISRLRDLDARR